MTKWLADDMEEEREARSADCLRSSVVQIEGRCSESWRPVSKWLASFAS